MPNEKDWGKELTKIQRYIKENGGEVLNVEIRERFKLGESRAHRWLQKGVEMGYFTRARELSGHRINEVVWKIKEKEEKK